MFYFNCLCAIVKCLFFVGMREVLMFSDLKHNRIGKKQMLKFMLTQVTGFPINYVVSFYLFLASSSYHQVVLFDEKH